MSANNTALNIIRFNETGWRAKNITECNDNSIARIAEGLATFWADRYEGLRVYIGYDTREHAKEYAQVAASVLSAFGFKVRLSDSYCPISALSYTVAQDHFCCGGLMISASGSPTDYQGISFRNSQGCDLSIDELAEVSSLIPNDASICSGTYQEVDIVSPYCEALKALIDVKTIKEARLRVLVDPMYGCAKGILADLLRSIGCEVVEIHNHESQDFNGLHPRVVEPWIDECERSTYDLDCIAGFVLDGDGDRSGAVGETGHFISQHLIASLLVTHLKNFHGLTGQIVVPLSESNYIKQVVEKAHEKLVETPIGFTWEIQQIQNNKVLLATDSLGGISYPHHMIERDGLLTVLYLVEMIAVNHKSLRTQVKELQKEVGCLYYGTRELAVDLGKLQVVKNLLPGCNPEQIAGKTPVNVTHGDGVKIEFENHEWGMVRASRSSQVLRLYAEGKTKTARDAIVDSMIDYITEMI